MKDGLFQIFKAHLPAEWRNSQVSYDAAVQHHPRGEAVGLLLRETSRRPAEQGVALFDAEGELIVLWEGALSCSLRWIDDGEGLLLYRDRLTAEPARELVLSHFAWPSLEEVGRCELPAPGEGVGGFELVTSPKSRYASVFLYSGQSELGFELFSIRPHLERIASLPYVFGDNDLTPTIFSPDERFAALAVRGDCIWWASNIEDADWDSPAEGGEVEWARIYLYDLEHRTMSEHFLVVNLPRGWIGDDEEQGPEELRFVSSRELRFDVPWADELTIQVPPGEKVRVPPP